MSAPITKSETTAAAAAAAAAAAVPITKSETTAAAAPITNSNLSTRLKPSFLIDR